MTRLEPTPVPDVPAIWPRIRPHILRAMKRSDGWWTEKELKERAFLGQIAVWQIKDGDRIIGCCLGEIEDWPSGKRVAVIVGCGAEDGYSIERHLPEVEAWARMHGAAEVHVRGREGWRRRLKPHGYELCMITLRKVL